VLDAEPDGVLWTPRVRMGGKLVTVDHRRHERHEDRATRVKEPDRA
jgi:hypothetical protein